MSISTPYSDFQAPNTVLAEEGGPWRTPASTSDLFCWTGSKSGFCSPYGCIPCTYKAASVILSFNVKYIANVSLPLSQYGNPDYVDYTFDYNLNWASDKTAAGAPLSARVSVGDSSSIENFGASDHAWLWYSNAATLGDPFHHAGTTSLLKSADGLTGYIPIIIDFSFTRQIGSDCHWYFIGGNFRITPKATTGNSPSSGPGTIAAGTSASSLSSVTGSVTQLTSHSLTSIFLPGFSTQSVSSSLSGQGPTGGGSNSSSSPNVGDVSAHSAPTAAIIGGVLGGLSLLGFFALFLLLLYRRKIRQVRERDRNNLMKNAGAAGGEENDGGSTRRTGTTTVHSESFIGFDMSLGGSKYPNQSEGFTNAAGTPFVIPSPPNHDGSPHQNAQPTSQRRGSRRRRATRRDHRPQPSLSNYGTAYNMDVPPPAYSDVNETAETTDGHGRGNGETDDTFDEEEEYEDEGGFSGSSRLDAMSQPSDDVQSESHEMSIMRRVPMQGSGRGHDWVHSGDERTGGRP
ncbi:hypothetical protein FRC18_006497, partial [Serendipita sp. 400]